MRTSTVPSVWCSGRLVFLLFTRLARARSPRPRGRFENPTTRCKMRALYFMKNTNYHKNIYFFMGGKCISSDVFSISHTASSILVFTSWQFLGDPYSMTSRPILKICTYFRSRDAKLSNQWNSEHKPPPLVEKCCRTRGGVVLKSRQIPPKIFAAFGGETYITYCVTF